MEKGEYMGKKEEYYQIYDEEDSRNYEELYEYEVEDDEMELIEELDESYEDVYDSDGDSVYCDYCQDVEIKLKDGVYICPNCGQIMDLETFLNYIGVDSLEK